MFADENKRNTPIKFTTIDDFEMGSPVGMGRFGQIWTAKHRPTGFISAIKIISIDSVRHKSEVKNIRREVEVHLSLNHPNILQMYGYFYDSMNLYLVMEYAGGGDLWLYAKDYRHKHSREIPEKHVANFTFQLCSALGYMHSNNIIHRDIKPENILIGCDGSIKVADFGWSVYNGDSRRQTFCGTVEYLPPELCKDEIYDFKADVWCVGILVFELCTGKAPISGKYSLNSVKKKILTESIVYPPYLSEHAVDFISKCCKKDPHTRITMSEALSHPFLHSSATGARRNYIV